MDSLEAGLEPGPVGRSIEGMKLDLLSWDAFCDGGGGLVNAPGSGMSAGAMIDEEVWGNESAEGSSMSGSESDSSSTRA